MSSGIAASAMNQASFTMTALLDKADRWAFEALHAIQNLGSSAQSVLGQNPSPQYPPVYQASDISALIDMSGLPVSPSNTGLNIGTSPAAPYVDPYVALPTLIAPVAPTVPVITLPILPVMPVAPVVQPVGITDLPVAPTADMVRPIITVPVEPSMFSAEAPISPVIGGPDVPLITPKPSEAITALPPLMIPELHWEETMYDSSMLEELNARLLDWITNGGTGLPVAVEKQIWDRMRERSNSEGARAKTEVTRQWSGSGWRLPAPAMEAAILQAEQVAIDASLDASRQVAIKQAELEQTNRQFAFKTALELETQLMNFINQMRTRIFESQKSWIELLISGYNAYIARRTAEVELIKVQASVWETENKLTMEQVKMAWEVEQTKLQVFAEEVKAYATKVQANVAQWDAWAKAVNASLFPLEIYKVDANVYQAKIDGYKSIVQARTSVAETQINSAKLILSMYASNLQGYDTQVKGIATIADAQVKTISLPIEAYKASVAGYAADASAKTDLTKVVASLKNLPVELYKSQVAGFGALVDAEAKRVNALVATYTSQVEAYKAKIQAEGLVVDSKIKAQTLIADSSVKNAQVAIENYKAQSAFAQARATALASIGEAIGKVSGNFAASALSSINVSVGGHGSGSDSESKSTNTSYSYAQSNSYIHSLKA